MALWKISLMWAGLVLFRLIPAVIKDYRDVPISFGTESNEMFWFGYIFVWALCFRESQETSKESGVALGLFILAWVFLVAISCLGIKVLFWTFLGPHYGLQRLFIWGELFTVIYCTIGLFIPIWLDKHSINRQGVL